MSDATSRLWLVYADERRAEWARYQGGCECDGCREFSARFTTWLAERVERLEGENVRLRDELAAVVEVNR